MHRAERLEAVGRARTRGGVARRRGRLLGDGGEEHVHCNTRRSGVVDAPGGSNWLPYASDANNTAVLQGFTVAQRCVSLQVIALRSAYGPFLQPRAPIELIGLAYPPFLPKKQRLYASLAMFSSGFDRSCPDA
jgi:hypothetical protein